MLFNSFAFVVLVAATFLIYYYPFFYRFQVHVLIAASLIFYAWHDASLLILLIASASINTLTSYFVVYGNAKHRKTIAVVGVVSNLLILAFFKYANLIVQTITLNTAEDLLLSIPLPIGISFYTFQGISLVVDVFRKNSGLVSTSIAQHSKHTLFFISFFPQLVAGPIVKAHEFLPQIKRKVLAEIQWNRVFNNIVIGYFLKMVVADNLKDFTFWIAYPYFQSKDSITLLTMLLGYSCQIFADFAGYSLIAIGIAGLFGYNLNDNFNFPYIAASFKEFWKRWHISLSTFLMEYLYIPMGGNRKGKLRTYFNLIVTMFLGGLWHGASWSFAVWGLFHGLALAIERLLSTHHTGSSNIRLGMKRVFIFIMVTFAWLLFKLPFNQVIEYLLSIVKNVDLKMDVQLCVRILVYSSPVWLYHFCYLVRETSIFQSFFRHRYIAYASMLFLILTNSGLSGAFIYFQF